MAAVTGCASTALAGQSLLKPVNELSRQAGTCQARVTIAKAGGSPWLATVAELMGLGIFARTDLTAPRSMFSMFGFYAISLSLKKLREQGQLHLKSHS